jgi:hypothetical protein
MRLLVLVSLIALVGSVGAAELPSTSYSRPVVHKYMSYDFAEPGTKFKIRSPGVESG